MLDALLCAYESEVRVTPPSLKVTQLCLRVCTSAGRRGSFLFTTIKCVADAECRTRKIAEREAIDNCALAILLRELHCR
eukprot:2376399-Pleurochrysis_carterae.AAC.2